MANNKYPPKAFVFISQTDGNNGAEYKKYRFQEKPTCPPNPSRDFEWRFSVSQQTLRVFMHKRSQVWLGKSGWEQLGYGDDKEKTHKLADWIDSGSPKAIEPAKTIFGVEGSIHKQLRDFCNDIIFRLDAANLSLGELKIDKFPCTIFMHWGGGEETDYHNREIFIQKYLPAGWKFFSIGTRRNEVFNVDGSTIIIPDRLGLEELERNLDFEGKKVDARKIMTEYVLESQNASDTSVEASAEGASRPPTNCDVFNETVSKVVEDSGEKWNSGYLDEDERTCRAKLVAKYFENKSSGCKHIDEEVAELFTKILGEEA